MEDVPSINHSGEPSNVLSQFEELNAMVKSEFVVDEGFLDHNVPTFYVRLSENSKEAFLRLSRKIDQLGLTSTLRRRDGRVVLQVVPTPTRKPSRNFINIVLFLATIGTVFLAGYLQSPDDIVGTVMFVTAIMATLGSHEMGHKLAANKHNVDATYPYFIPGTPPIGTFGALIQQKSLPPNKDALFDLGASGPILGFIVTIIVSLIGIKLSHLEIVEAGTSTLPTPIVFQLFTSLFPPGGNIIPNGEGMLVVVLHPLAFAGWVGMFVTLVNLVPAGMLDGGHITQSFLGGRSRTILAYVAIAILFMLGPWFYFMALFALFFSMYRHPAPLDDVSKLSRGRKFAALMVAAIFILCIDWFSLIQTLTQFLP